MSSVEQAAAAVVAEWRDRPHAVIAVGLRRAIEALALALDDGQRMQAMQAAHERRIDEQAWGAVLNGHDTGTAT